MASYDMASFRETPTPTPTPPYRRHNSVAQQPLTPQTPEKPNRKACLFRCWCENTTCHGIIDWYKSGTVARLFWFLLVVAFAAMAGWQIHALCRSFFAKPHFTTNVYLEDADASDFPNVTVCNRNRINGTMAEEIGLSNDAIAHLYTSMIGLYDVETTSAAVTPDGKRVPDMSAMIKQKMAWSQFWPQSKMKDPEDLFVKLGHNCKETFCQCKFGGTFFDCCSHAKPIINAEYGLCWTITPPIMKNYAIPRQVFPGAPMGLRLYVNPSLAHYSKVFMNNYLEEGIVVVATFHPHDYWYQHQLSFAPGTHASVHLENQLFHFNKPLFQVFEPTCSTDASTKFGKGNYSLLNCVANCMHELTSAKCECFMVGEVKDKTFPSCTPDQALECVFPKLFAAMNDMLHNNGTSKMYKCMMGCKSPCERGKMVKQSASINNWLPSYHVTELQDLFESMSEVKFGYKMRPPAELVKSYIVLDLYFSERGHTVVESEAKIAIFTLIGNIGGQLGLWMGASIITVIQALYYLTIFFFPMLTANDIENRQ